MKHRIVALLLCFVIVASVILSGCSDKVPKQVTTAVDDTVTFTPLTASGDSVISDNPDRGFRTQFVLYIEKTKEPGIEYDKRTFFCDMTEDAILEKIDFIVRIYFPTGSWHDSKLVNSYVYLTSFHDYEEIPESAVKIIKIYFDTLRKKKIKQNLRIAYNYNYALYNGIEENKLKLVSECATQEIILKHIDQLAPVINEYADTMHKISCGFIGYGGEQAVTYQWPPVNYNTVIKAVVEKWCVPNNLYYSVRLPEYEYNLKKTEPDWQYFGYIGFNNDAMYGEQTNNDWNSAGFQKGNPKNMNVDWWEYAAKEAAYSPQDGEMFTNSVLLNYNMVPTGMQIILECFRHRYVGMSQWHSYLEARNGVRKGIMQGWIDYQTITPELLDKNGIIYDPNWFVDDNGNSVMRNPYEFLRDHLGYKLVAQNATIKSDEDSVNITMTLKNYGFAAAFNLASGFAILDENYNVISTVDAGNPYTWYNRDPEDPYATAVLEHTVSAEIALPQSAGNYYIGFYLKNTAGHAATLSNKLDFEGGCNILYQFEAK